MSRAVLILVGLGALALCVVGGLIDPKRALIGWLSAAMFALQIPLGALMMLSVHALTGGGWGDRLGARFERMLAMLPVALLALAVIVIGQGWVFSWVHEPVPANAFYLNPVFFSLRAVTYAVLWIWLAVSVRHRHVRGALGEGFAAAALIILVITQTLAWIDWTMSLDPRFASTIYGMLQIAGTALTAFAAAIVLDLARAPGPVEGAQSIGKMLLGAVILWAYLAFMQLLIVWSSDLADENTWYILRERGVWGAVAVSIAALHFLLPFGFLIFPGIRSARRALFAIAALLLVMRALDAWWLVLPTEGAGLGVAAPGALVAIGAAMAAFGLFAPLAQPVDPAPATGRQAA